MLTYREIRQTDDKALAGIIRTNLKAHGLDIPGTVYFDDNLDHLSNFYLEDKSERYYLIALKDNKVAGGVGLASVEFIEDCAELQKLYLDDANKGKGYGYILIDMIEEKARELGYKKMYLETHTNLSAAIHIYEKCGYEEIPKPECAVHSTMNRFFIKEL